MSLSLLLFVHR
uniref:Uncharacterized protein n=1 Tax=Anguilla anguilla TaxID=7936 RepID=A0A0E9PH12_ANGAN